MPRLLLRQSQGAVRSHLPASLVPCPPRRARRHFSWDAEIDGVRYVQWPLGYPHEHGRRRNGGEGWEPLALYDTERGPAPHKHCYWSDYCAYGAAAAAAGGAAGTAPDAA